MSQGASASTATDPAFLAPTDLCDANHPAIKKAALSLYATGDSPTEQAVKVYHHVQDEVRFRISQLGDNASDTLASGWGHCYQKANLEVALLRSPGIPAGFIMQQIAPEVMPPSLPAKRCPSLAIRCGASMPPCISMAAGWQPTPPLTAR